jgi:hypothetical protein
MDPTAWIDEECYPSGFQWADPSKIQVGQVFRLLDHWRQREESGLTPLIWNSSCELLADMERQSKPIRSRSKSQNNRDSDSDSGEENFAAQLGKISESDSESDPTQPLSPSPSQRGLRSLEPDEAEEADLECLAPPAVPHHSCKSELSIYAFASYLPAMYVFRW